MPANLPRVVIVGGGFGGLYAARALAGAPVSITLIDRRNYHLFRPMLYLNYAHDQRFERWSTRLMLAVVE